MAEASNETHKPEELQSDLNLLVGMVRDGREDEEFIRRHLESLKAKLDRFVHHGIQSRGGSAR
jgi:hypothetical protein